MYNAWVQKTGAQCLLNEMYTGVAFLMDFLQEEKLMGIRKILLEPIEKKISNRTENPKRTKTFPIEFL